MYDGGITAANLTGFLDTRVFHTVDDYALRCPSFPPPAPAGQIRQPALQLSDSSGGTPQRRPRSTAARQSPRLTGHEQLGNLWRYDDSISGRGQKLRYLGQPCRRCCLVCTGDDAYRNIPLGTTTTGYGKRFHDDHTERRHRGNREPEHRRWFGYTRYQLMPADVITITPIDITTVAGRTVATDLIATTPVRVLAPGLPAPIQANMMFFYLNCTDQLGGCTFLTLRRPQVSFRGRRNFYFLTGSVVFSLPVERYPKLSQGFPGSARLPARRQARDFSAPIMTFVLRCRFARLSIAGRKRRRR